MISSSHRERQQFRQNAQLVGILVIYGVGFWLLGVIGMGGMFALTAAIMLVRYRIENPSRKKAVAAPTDPTAITLGSDAKGHSVALGERQLAAHAVILGATGSGKTTTLLRLLCEAIVRGQPVIALDLKGSETFARQLWSACYAAGRRFHAWTPEGPGHWNPLAYGDASELKDKLISFEQFTEPHYQRAAERYLQTAIQVLQQVRPYRPVTLGAVVNLLEPDNLRALLQRAPKETLSRVGPYVSNLNRDQRSAVSGLGNRLAVIAESKLGQYLQPGEKPIDPWHALSGGPEVILFSLNSSRYGKLAAQVAALVIQDLIAAASRRFSQADKPLAFVAIDEFSSLQADNLLNLIARAREAGISVVLSTQEMADLERLAAGFRDQVLGNTGVLVAHRQNVPDSAELIARMIGTDTVWQKTHQTDTYTTIFGRRKEERTGMGSARQVEEFRIHPNKIKELPTGNAVLITKTPTSSAQIIQVSPWTPPAPAADAH